MKTLKRRLPDHLEDQCRGFLVRRKDQTVTQDLIDDFMAFFWPRKKKADLLIMKQMVKDRENFNIADYNRGGI